MIKSFKHPFSGDAIWNDGPEFENFMGRESAPAIAGRHLCFGGGKSGTSTQSQSSNTAAPGNVQAWATELYGNAYNTAKTPFQQYGGQFVAPINDQQTQGISGINSAAGMYAPYGQAATQTLAPYFGQATQSLGQGLSAGQGLTGAGVGLTAANANLNPNTISSFMSPYIGNVVQATENQQNQQNAQQQSQLSGSAIQSGAFGGDRSGVAAANLAYQQNLANQPVIANLYNTGYQQALGAAQQQQQTGLSAGAQLGALGNQFYSQGLGGSQQYANLGSGLSSAYSGLGTTAQTNALNAAQAQVGAGTLQQQTQQAQDTALYNQFLQQQAYPFQTSQYLANILEGIAPAFGANTTSTGSATQPMSFFQRGGRVGRAAGGLSANNDNDVMAQLIAAQAGMYPGAARSSAGGPYGLSLSQHGSFQLPQAHLSSMSMNRPESSARSAMQGLNSATQFGENLGKVYSSGKGAIVGTPQTTGPNGTVVPATGGLGGYGGKWGASAPVSPTAQGGASNVIYIDPNGVQNGGLSSPVTGVDPNDYSGTYKRGGRVGLAYGGIPYADQINNPIVPADIASPIQASQAAEANLMRPSSQGMSGGQMSSGLGSGLKGLGQIASLASMFLKDGGRIHKDTGGGLSDPVNLISEAPIVDPRIEKARHAIGTIEAGGINDKAYGTVGPETKMPNGSTARPHGAYGVMDFNIPQWTKEATGKEMTPQEFLKDQKAQDAVFAHRYGKYLNDTGSPQDAASMWFSGKPQAQAGNAKDVLGTTVPAYVSKFNSLYGNGQASADVTAVPQTYGAPTTAVAPDKQSWWDKDSGGLSGGERGVISLLSGLGGMASSPSRFFGGALLSGLGAGANTYGALAQKGRGLDISQQQANTSQGQLGIAQTTKNIEVYNILRQQAGGYIRAGQPVPPQLKAQIDSLAASLPTGGSPTGTPVPYSPPSIRQPDAPQQIPAPTNRAPVTATPLEPPKSEPTVAPNIAEADFRRKLGPARDPAVMRQKADELASIGDAQGAKDLMAQAQATEDRMMTTGKAIDANGNVIDVPGFAQQQAANTRIEPNQKWLDEQGTGALQRAQAREQLDVIKGVLENYESGSLAGMKAQAQALGKALGVQVPDTATMNAAAYEKFLKSTLRNVFSDVKDMGGRPLVSEIQGFEKATASPELQPEANKEILAQLYGKLNQQDKFYGDAATEMSKNKALDRGSFTNEWLKRDENKVAPMVEETKKNLAVRGATPSASKDFKEGHTYIVDEGRFPGYPAGKYRAVRKDGKFGLEKVE